MKVRADYIDIGVPREFAQDPDVWRRIPAGVVLGAALDGPHEFGQLLMIDADGVVWKIAEGTRPQLVRWSLQRAVRVHPSFGDLVANLERGYCVGLLAGLGELAGVSPTTIYGTTSKRDRSFF